MSQHVSYAHAQRNAKTGRNQVWVTTEWTYGQNDTESGGNEHLAQATQPDEY